MAIALSQLSSQLNAKGATKLFEGTMLIPSEANEEDWYVTPCSGSKSDYDMIMITVTSSTSYLYTVGRIFIFSEVGNGTWHDFNLFESDGTHGQIMARWDDSGTIHVTEHQDSRYRGALYVRHVYGIKF
ncbi:hypothetical protein JCM19235_1226 [Vibrio maritimus]|uniref:Uncharacterized protein n=1 Tax=Vibrio maritimus TaxID=990268 RepID=A0A090S5D6_9VIBR|nr:hypothetical protein JCM19235_1226 [Vibrio maritimus]